MDALSIGYCKDRLQEQLERAKESLKGVDDNLKKFVSKSTSDVPLRPAFNKTTIQSNDKWKTNRDENFSNNPRRRPARVLNDADIENIPVKKRLGPKVLHSSISGPPKKYEDIEENRSKKPAVLSCVVAKPHALPSRKDAVSVKTYTETRARDRRMFGALLGTLQKFRQEETQLKDKEDKKAKVEKKLEEAAKREKEKLRLDRQKLMDLKKQKESYIKAVENNMKLVKEQEQWEELQRPLFNYIRTESTPSICYLPKIHNDETSKLLNDCRSNLTKLIEEKRCSVKEEVDALISQWQNVDFEEIARKVSEPPQNASADHSNVRNSAEIDESLHDSNVTNGSWSNNDVERSRNAGNSAADVSYSAKEQRLKIKSKTANVLVKEEKEDDYNELIFVKQEKDTPIKMSTDEEGDICNSERSDNAEDDIKTVSHSDKETKEVYEEEQVTNFKTADHDQTDVTHDFSV